MLFLAAESHDMFHPRPVIPTAIEYDYFACRGEVLHVSLHVKLALFPVRGGGQRDDAEYTRADTLGDSLDRAAFAGPIAALEHEDAAQAFVFHPFLQFAELHLK